MSLKNYEQYKDSGVKWLGNVPEHWAIKQLKMLASLVNRGNSPQYSDEEQIVKVLNQACIYWDSLRLENIKYDVRVDIAQEKGYLRKGDLLINSTGTGTLGRAQVFNIDGEFLADSHVTVIRPRQAQINSVFLFYLVRTRIYQDYIFYNLVTGSTNQIELSCERLKATPIPIPPIYEQTTIVTFLNHEMAKIDALIAQQQRLIELLKEKRQAMISHAVTGKIDVRGFNEEGAS